MEHTTNRYQALAGIIRADLRTVGITSDRDAADRANIPSTTYYRRMSGDAFHLDELERLAALAGTTAAAWLTRLDAAKVAA